MVIPKPSPHIDESPSLILPRFSLLFDELFVAQNWRTNSSGTTNKGGRIIRRLSFKLVSDRSPFVVDGPTDLQCRASQSIDSPFSGGSDLEITICRMNAPLYDHRHDHGNERDQQHERSDSQPCSSH